jgi:hypothetical protein
MKRTNRRDDEWDDDSSYRDDREEDEGPDGDDDFDYEEFIENEFGGGNARSVYSPLIKLTAFLLLVLFVVLAFVQIGF